MKTVKEEIANNLLFYRKRAKFTQRELANQIGVKNNTISQWESGTNSIDVEILFKICEILDVSVNDMYGSYAHTNSLAPSAEENRLLENYRTMNEEGREKVEGYISDLVQTGRYKKTW